jgi:hypothetical protein
MLVTFFLPVTLNTHEPVLICCRILIARMVELVHVIEKLLSESGKDETWFAYSGSFDDSITGHIIDLNLHAGPSKLLPDKKQSKRMSFLLVESFQNLVRHTEKGDEMARAKGMFSFGGDETGYDIDSLNVVSEATAKSVEDTIKHLNSLDESELDRTFKDRLNDPTRNEAGGAGLGLIEIARKSGRKVRCMLYPRSGNNVLLHQHVFFRPQDTDADYHKLHNERVLSRYKDLENHHIILEFLGDFNSESIKPLFHILKENVLTIHRNELKVVGLAMLEMFQNISKHAAVEGEAKRGVFALSYGPENSGSFILTGGNRIAGENVQKLDARLTELKGLTTENLSQFYLEQMKKGIHSTDPVNSGLGLIELAKYSLGRMNWIFTRDDDSGAFFFGLSVEVN